MKKTTSIVLAGIVALASVSAFTSCETTSVRKLGKDKRPIAQKLRNSTFKNL